MRLGVSPLTKGPKLNKAWFLERGLNVKKRGLGILIFLSVTCLGQNITQGDEHFLPMITPSIDDELPHPLEINRLSHPLEILSLFSGEYAPSAQCNLSDPHPITFGDIFWDCPACDAATDLTYKDLAKKAAFGIEFRAVPSDDDQQLILGTVKLIPVPPHFFKESGDVVSPLASTPPFSYIWKGTTLEDIENNHWKLTIFTQFKESKTTVKYALYATASPVILEAYHYNNKGQLTGFCAYERIDF